MYTQCEKCKAIIPRMAVRCTTCGRSRMKEVFDSNVSSWKNPFDRVTRIYNIYISKQKEEV